MAHVVWSVRDRQPVLLEQDDQRRIQLFRVKAEAVGAEVLAAGCAADHAHVLVRFPAARPLSEVVQRLKGASAHLHNQEHPEARLSWQDGFWARSCNPGRLAEITAYIERQREHHRSAPGLESWVRPPSA